MLGYPKQLNYNRFLSVEFSAATGAPIILDDVKAHLNITFTDDDTLLNLLVNQCIDSIEQYCICSILTKTVTIQMDMVNEFELPYGPVTGFTSSSLKSAINTYTILTANKDYEVDTTLQFARYVPYSCQYPSRIKIIYTAGYTTLPTSLKLAVLNEIAFRYENRGDSVNRYAQQNVGISEGAEALAAPYRRVAAWLGLYKCGPFKGGDKV